MAAPECFGGRNNRGKRKLTEAGEGSGYSRLRARIEGGLSYADRDGVQRSISAFCDGIGRSDCESFGASHQRPPPDPAEAVFLS